jgi:hypothetical protein
MITRIIISITAILVFSAIDVAIRDDNALAQQSIVQSAVGGGYHEHSVADRIAIFSFHALRFSDGTTKGWYHAQVRLRPPRARIIARIDCLHVVGNVAWMGGVIESAVDPDNVGRRLFVKAVDNGEGAEASPDEIGGAWRDADCTTEPDAELKPLLGGNVEIREADAQ